MKGVEKQKAWAPSSRMYYGSVIGEKSVVVSKQIRYPILCNSTLQFQLHFVQFHVQEPFLHPGSEHSSQWSKCGSKAQVLMPSNLKWTEVCFSQFWGGSPRSRCRKVYFYWELLSASKVELQEEMLLLHPLRDRRAKGGQTASPNPF